MIGPESRKMNWNLTDDQQMVRDMVREFVAAEVAPNAAEWDRRKYFPSEIFEKLGELGLFGMVADEEYGGAGLDLIGYCLVLEEIARGDASTCVAINVTEHPSRRRGFFAPASMGNGWEHSVFLSRARAQTLQRCPQ